MSTTLFTHLANSDASWICPICDQPNFSVVPMNSPIVTSADRSYNNITDSMRSVNFSSIATPTWMSTSHSFNRQFLSSQDSTPGSTPGLPQATSSPQQTKTRRCRNSLKNNIKLAIINCRSLKNKIPELETFTSLTEPDIVIGTESWLTPDIKNSEVFPSGFSIFRRDRQFNEKKSGGGVFIMTRKPFVCSEIDIKTDCEMLAVNLELVGQQNVKIVAFYRPPWSDDKYMEDFADALKNVDHKHKGNIWLGGDFNLPNIDWENENLLTGNTNPKLSNMLIDTANDLFLTQTVTSPTRMNNTLDLFFTTNPTLINKTSTAPPLSHDADHDIVLVDLDTRAAIPKQTNTSRFIYSKADWIGMETELSSYVLIDGSVQERWDHFEGAIIAAMKKNIPYKPTASPRHKPWVTRELKTLLHMRNRKYKKSRNSKSPTAEIAYKKLKSKCQKLLRKCHNNYRESIFDTENAGSKFWSYVKQKRTDSCSVAPLRENGVLVSDSAGKANILNKQYCSVFNPDNRGSEPSKGDSSTPNMPKIEVTDDGVKKLLQSLSLNKAAGPDQISPMVLKNLADVLSKHLSIIFQQSIDTGTVPSQWKTALVTPIFKKGDKHKPANYRPVSLTAVCSKLCEHIIAKSVLNHLDHHNLLSDCQHGFRRNRSCESQLVLFIDELTCAMTEGKQVDAIIMDFSKAFDVVPHGSLLVKLAYYGIRGSTLGWIDSFLNGRTQRVIVDGVQSQLAPVTSGVPQGSVLGPILFLTYINDMPECITSQARLFADDTIVYRTIEDNKDCETLQSDLQSLEAWEAKWGMCFNPSKCETIHITRKKHPLVTPYILKAEELRSTKNSSYLGVSIAPDLSWNNQVAKVAAKGNRALGFIKRNIKSSSREIKTKAYNSLVRPTLEYASSVWAPGYTTLSDTIEKVQRRAARFVCNKHSRQESVTAMLAELGWDTLEERRNKSRVTMLFKIIHAQVAIPSAKLIPTTKSTRGNPMKFRKISTRTNYHKFSFFPTAITLWNSLTPHISQITDLDDFKSEVSAMRLPSPIRH